jgi:hypothetical protein
VCLFATFRFCHRKGRFCHRIVVSQTNKRINI